MAMVHQAAAVVTALNPVVAVMADLHPVEAMAEAREALREATAVVLPRVAINDITQRPAIQLSTLIFYYPTPNLPSYIANF